MCNSIPNPSLAPAPRSYHLLTTLSPIHGHKLLGTLYPYRTRICCYDDENSLFSTKLTSPSPPQHRHPGTYKLRVLNALLCAPRLDTSYDAPYASVIEEKINGVRHTPSARRLKKVARGACAPLRHWYYYQLAFFTPGIRPLDAISRN